MIVDCGVYENGVRVGGRVPLADALESCRLDTGGFVWIGLFEPTSEELEDVAREFDLHPLAVEDAVHAHQRAKLESYGDVLFLVFKTVTYIDHEEIINVGDLMLFIGPQFVISVRHGSGGDMSRVRHEMDGQVERLKRGPAEVVHTVADRVVDEYQRVLRSVEEDIDQIQVDVFSGPKATHAERIFRLKREVLEFRQAVIPLAEPLHLLATVELPAMASTLHEYFRDVHDHLVRVADRLVAIDDLLSDALAANVAQVGMRQNEDMRKISAWVAIVSVPTMIAGVYGMNFEHMPELETAWGYPVVLVVIALCCFGLYRNFKRREWL